MERHEQAAALVERMTETYVRVLDANDREDKENGTYWAGVYVGLSHAAAAIGFNAMMLMDQSRVKAEKMEKRTIAGREIILEKGKSYRAQADMGTNRISIIDDAGQEAISFEAKSYEARNAFLKEFNNGLTSWDYRTW